MRYIYILFVAFSLSTNAQSLSTNCLNNVTGQVINKGIDEGIPNTLITIKNQAGDISTITTESDGKFAIDLPCKNSRYTFNTTIENFTSSSRIIFFNKDIARKYNVILNHYPIQEFIIENGKKRITLESIEFLPNEININPESAVLLDKVSSILTKYPSMNIEIGFHTDSRGIEKHLLELTGKRADACASYLINKGIESSRIIAKGYGSTELLNECKKDIKCSNRKHLINRRSEFVVLP